jgi:two-component system phosphate regulon sensor histidine kinase PhoR
LKFGKNLYILVAVVAVSALLASALLEWQASAAGPGRQLADRLHRLGPVLPVCYVVAAAGVIWLAWSWLRLAGATRSFAASLKQDKVAFVKAAPNAVTNVLSEAVSDYRRTHSDRIDELEKQVKDLHIKVQLSQKRERNAEAIIYSIRDAVIVIDEFDNLLMANEAAGRLLSFDFRGSRHRPLSEVVGAETDQTGKSEFVHFLKRTRQSKGQATRRELEFLGEAGPRTFDCIVSRVCDRNDRICGVVAVLHDVTREKEVSQMKNDFVSHVSHELKTPLASITAYSEMLADGEAEDEQTRKEFYSVIQNQAKRLNRLIEDILNTSRIESGLIKVNKEPVSLTILIEEQLQMIRSFAEEKNIKVTGQTPIVFDQVNADRDMISQVIVNLLGNAVKYTPSGGSVSIETQVDDIDGLVRVSVTDTGVGIPTDEIEHVFDKFYRVKVNERQAGGTGLGLNLVKQIVEKVHAGRVFVRSEVGAGSTFGFELPLAKRQAVGAA